MNITVSPLDGVCEVIMGQAPSGDVYNTEGQGWSLIAGAGDFGDVYPAAKKFTTEASKLSRTGDIILGIRATVGEKVLSDGEYCLGRGVAALRPRSTLDSRYLWHWLDHIRPHLVSKAKGATFKQVNRQDIGELAISLPPIAEQKRIAAILDKAEELRGLRRRALSQLDAIAQSIFLEMFGDPVTNPKGWTVLSLANLVSEFRYGSSDKSRPYGKPALRIPNVIDGSLDLSDLKLVPVDDSEFERLRMRNGDILFVRTNGNPDFVGRCAVFDYRLVANTGFAEDEFIFASYLIRARLSLESIVPLFLREFLLGTSGRRELRSRCKTSAGQFNVNIPSLGAIPIPIPPLNLQQEFARRVEAIAQLKTTYRESLAQLDALFASLQHRAFSPSETLRERGEL